MPPKPIRAVSQSHESFFPKQVLRALFDATFAANVASMNFFSADARQHMHTHPGKLQPISIQQSATLNKHKQWEATLIHPPWQTPSPALQLAWCALCAPTPAGPLALHPSPAANPPPLPRSLWTRRSQAHPAWFRRSHLGCPHSQLRSKGETYKKTNPKEGLYFNPPSLNKNEHPLSSDSC